MGPIGREMSFLLCAAAVCHVPLRCGDVKERYYFYL